MMKNLIWIIPCLWLVACIPAGPSEEALRTQAAVEVYQGWTQEAQQRTAIAAEIYASQTAAAPTATYTPTSTPLPTATPTLPPTPTQTYTRTPTLTPLFTPTQTPEPVPDAIVLVNELGVYAGPSTTYARDYNVYYGNPLKVLGQAFVCEWLFVQMPDGNQGWVDANPLNIEFNQPCASLPWHPYRPLNGEILVDRRSEAMQVPFSGGGVFKVENGTDKDGLIVLAQFNKTLLAFFVRAKNNVSMDRIPNGVYDVYFTTGENWNGGLGKFEIIYQTSKFDESFPFTSTATSYTIWTITLHPVAGGTGSTTPVDPDDFPSLVP